MADAVHVSAGPLAATFLPTRGMFGASFRYRGEELFARMGMPLMYPWANRLRRRSYRVGDRRVRLAGLPLPVDANGCLIHGVANLPFRVVRATTSSVTARVATANDALLARAFPFPHDVTVTVTLDAKRMRIATSIRPTGAVAVPVSFGWHPDFRLPGLPRRDWVLDWPACTRIELATDLLPTGISTAQPATNAPIGSRRFDDHYTLGRRRTFGLSAGRRTLTLAFDRNYPYAELWVPPRRSLVAIEPMTAPVDALGTGTTPFVEPGERFRATFTIAVA